VLLTTPAKSFPTLCLLTKTKSKTKNRWDAQWPTQMFEKGYGLETRQGGWRYYRTREDKKDIDDEATLQTIMKSLENMVSKEQVCTFV